MQLFRLKRIRFFLLVPLMLLLTTLASRFPQVTERVYSTGVYPALKEIFGRLAAILPFSLAELLILALPIVLIGYIVRQIRYAVKHPEERRDRIGRLAATLLCLTGIIYGLFVVLCGFNYHRLSFAEISGLQTRPSSAEELALLCGELIQQANELRQGVSEDADGVMQNSFEFREGTAVAREGYALLGETYPQLAGYTTRAKPVLFSRGMSHLDLVGIYIPFTFEPNINTDVVDYVTGSSMMHELAHYKGFMREDEANFISYLACMSTDNADFRYSGTMLALVHSTNALYAADRDLYYAVAESMDDGIRRDFAANSAYWKQFEGPVAEASAAMNDVYLKSNRQESGVKSYGRMVDLLLADYRQRHGME